jgi:hypothetical protein
VERKLKLEGNSLGSDFILSDEASHT